MTESDAAELLRQAEHRLKTHRGTFVYSKSFGSRLDLLDAAAPGTAVHAAVLAQEALAPLYPKVKVLSTQTAENSIKIKIKAGQTVSEVTVACSVNKEEK